MLSANDLAELEASFDGRVLVEGSGEYESTFRSRMVRFEHVRPQAVAASPVDVGRALLAARATGIPFAVRSGGRFLQCRRARGSDHLAVGPRKEGRPVRSAPWCGHSETTTTRKDEAVKLTTTTQVSVDGVVQANGGPVENGKRVLERGGWARPLFDSEAMTFVDQTYQRCGCVSVWPAYLRALRRLLGREE